MKSCDLLKDLFIVHRLGHLPVRPGRDNNALDPIFKIDRVSKKVRVLFYRHGFHLIDRESGPILARLPGPRSLLPVLVLTRH